MRLTQGAGIDQRGYSRSTDVGRDTRRTLSVSTTRIRLAVVLNQNGKTA